MTTTTRTLPHLGLVGRAQVGKDTAAGQLTRIGYRRVAFADQLRSMAAAVDPLVEVPAGDGDGCSYLRLASVVDAVGWERAKAYPDVRRFLQRLGTDGVRDHLGRDLWVEAGMAQAKGPTVFTDVRFPNEAKAVRDAGGLVVRIVRDGVAPVSAHVSEEALDGWPVDATIVNDGPPALMGVALFHLIGV